MKLSDFIRRHSEEIAKEWEGFARTCEPAAVSMNMEQLRDHILPLLHFVADDIDEPQTASEQQEKAEGRQPRAEKGTNQAEAHAALRVIDGFTVDQVVGEYRALRASILRLWAKHPATKAELTQIIRFNESIDQMLAESVARHAELEGVARETSSRRDAFIATLSHELRGPLGALTNGVHLVEASVATNSTLGSVTAMMLRQTRHLSRLLNDLLDLARISRDRISLNLEPTDIRDCVQDAIDANRDVLTQRNHLVNVHFLRHL
jgi:signal transduction histidine kinase